MDDRAATAAETAVADRDLTGNHYVAFPDIDRRSGAVASLNLLHRGLNGLVGWSGGEEPLLRPLLLVDGAEAQLAAADAGRLDRWIPWVRFEANNLDLTVTYCAPGGFNPIVRGALLRLELRNRGSSSVNVVVGIQGCVAQTTRTISSTRPLGPGFRVVRGSGGHGIALEAGSDGLGAALGLCTDGDGVYHWLADDGSWRELPPGDALTCEQGTRTRLRCARAVELPAGARAAVGVYIGAAPERDGAHAAAAALAAIGSRELIRLARLDVAQLSRSALEPDLNDVLNRNLLFCHYFAAGRAIDDDRLYMLRTRVPGPGAATFNEREALMWTLPALAATDALLGREALLRSFEQYSHRPGEHLRYLDGGVLAPGMILDQVCAYPIALDRFVRETGDQAPLDEPIVQDVLREIDEALFSRLHPEVLLCRSDLLPSGERADYPYIAIGNVMLWAFVDALPRIWRAARGDPPPRFDGTAAEVRAAFWQRCTVSVDGVRIIACASDLEGNAAIYDDPAASLSTLPFLGLCDADDPIWSDTMELLSSSRYPLYLGNRPFPGLAGRSSPTVASFPALCASLLTPQRPAALDLLRKLPLPAGLAVEGYDPDTGAAQGPYAAAAGGLLAWSLLHDASRTKGSKAGAEERSTQPAGVFGGKQKRR